ncbi:hypothetical protein CVT24_001207 [Panaeolus cyanescens]|uniref:carbonic anhydrase n=1 Tax=Panaeolus cyanescens TaxID=181874 RepID=A0A409VTU4_9AGAR|nr:hypothetical protein CVT24_001207 [Panaeolus cyanescens]
MRAYSSLFFALTAISSVMAHPIQQVRELTIIGREQSIRLPRQDSSAAFDVLTTGHKAFKDNLAATDPGLLQRLADDGQAPPFMFLGCSDSRVNEGTVFNAAPGTFFSQRNIANQFQPNDQNAQAVLSYAVAVLGVEHVIVMGHYGCGGVAASIASAPTSGIDAANSAVQAWIQPIREIFQTSSRSEIVELRNKNAAAGGLIEEPEINEPGFRALVEENVKATVSRMASHSVMTNHFAALQAGNATLARRSGPAGPLKNVFIHGWVYDIETGEVSDLGVSVGPPGVAVPPAPFQAVAAAADKAAASHSSGAAHGTPAASEPVPSATSSPAAVVTPAAVSDPAVSADPVVTSSVAVPVASSAAAAAPTYTLEVTPIKRRRGMTRIFQRSQHTHRITLITMHAYKKLCFALAAISLVYAGPIYESRENDENTLNILSTGHKEFKKHMLATNPGLLQKLADDGQAPPFLFLGCSDSRVNEATVFNAAPGTFFSQRNIANEFLSNDLNSQAVLSYAVAALGVEHVIVMGHYGCGGVAASIASAPKSGIDAASSAVQAWIQPIREIFQTSSRREIVELRKKNAANGDHVEPPGIKDVWLIRMVVSTAGFRALVEENVRFTVNRIASNSVITNHYAALQADNTTVVRRAGPQGPLKDVFIHGWVYDIETGDISDLGISVGPPGKTVPPGPFKKIVTKPRKTSL